MNTPNSSANTAISPRMNTHVPTSPGVCVVRRGRVCAPPVLNCSASGVEVDDDTELRCRATFLIGRYACSADPCATSMGVLLEGTRARASSAETARRSIQLITSIQTKKTTVGIQNAIRPLNPNGPCLKKIINPAGISRNAIQKL